ncbi:iron ABC transporter ATP-binding protein [Geodermatophilus sp. Leaf369]|uniref:iron ABC transporter ATP-binding protein n=1 Tax=Geodermatophilus sp. Leaf369 TaxID=1736354 RepID=UPI0006FB648E|nr:ATP-binding cassette domain-containing protein [Geodermatophilus sp. Leaf369]KQS56913.1 iron ABC transporter ATP-binding protein [Geodermatophilus sp. Leaf369]
MITTTGVSKRHGQLLAVDDVTVDISPGLTAIIGPNGAGKSTLLAAIGRLARIEGAITVGGLDIAATRSKELARRLAILRQDNSTVIRLSVAELVAFGRFPHGGGGRSPEDADHVARALDLLGLTDVADRFLDELSGGQRQRAHVAMALAQDTDHLLLDEPLNNLDPRHAVGLMKLLTRLVADRRLTVVVVLHDLNVAARFADSVIAMREGRVVHHGPAAEVLTGPHLSELYETPARIESVAGQPVVVWE